MLQLEFDHFFEVAIHPLGLLFIKIESYLDAGIHTSSVQIVESKHVAGSQQSLVVVSHIVENFLYGLQGWHISRCASVIQDVVTELRIGRKHIVKAWDSNRFNSRNAFQSYI